MNAGKLLNRQLKEFTLKKPVVFTFNLNWKVYENFGLEQFNHIKTQFAMRNINVELLPILTSHRTDLENRVNQFKKGIEKICDKYDSKAHVVGYSTAGINPRAYISEYNGDQYINTLITIGTPNKYKIF